MKKEMSEQLLLLVDQAEKDDRETWIKIDDPFRSGMAAGRQMVYYNKLRNAISMLEDRSERAASTKEPEANERSEEDGRQGGDEGSGTEGAKGEVESGP